MNRSTRTILRTATALVTVAAVSATVACSAPQSSDDNSGGGSESSLVEQAKQEGEVLAGLGGHTQDQAEQLVKAFEAKYGIKVTYVVEEGGAIAQKVQAQLSSGKVQFDVVSLNDEATLKKWDADGILGDPEVSKADLIQSFVTNADAHYIPFAWQPMGYSYSTVKFAENEAPTTWTELAASGKTVAVADPSSSGAALTFFTSMEKMHPGFIEELGKSDTLISSSALALTQLVATGEADFGVPGIEPSIVTAANAGEPLKMGFPEGKITALPSYMAIFADGPHTAAGKLFMQFALSKEYQKAQAEAETRSVLQGVAAPSSLGDIEQDRLVVIPADEVKSSRDRITKAFDAAMGK